MTAADQRPSQRSWPFSFVAAHPFLTGIAGLAVLAFLFVAGPAFLSRAKQLLPRSETFGDILIDTPEVYTRERLVNDRFQQEAWLHSQLDRTAELIDSDRFAGTEGRLARAETTAAAMRAGIGSDGAGGTGDGDQGGTLTEPGGMDFKPSPIDEFRDAQAYRDVMRAELMRTQLDDRHDIEGNTLYRLDFDATVSPGDNTTDLAVVTVAIEEAEDEDDSMYGELYDDFHKELQIEIADAVRLQAVALMRSSEGLRGTDKLALEEHLHLQICRQLQEIAEAVDPKVSDGSDSSGVDVGETHLDCFSRIEEAVLRYTTKHVRLRREDFDLQYAAMLREGLSAVDATGVDLPGPLAALQSGVGLEPPSDDSSGGPPSDEFAASLRAKLDTARRILDDAAKYASFRCKNPILTRDGRKQFILIEGKAGETEDVTFDCPPDLNPNEATVATIGMLQRLKTIVADLERGAGSDLEQQPIKSGEPIKGIELADALRKLIGAAASPEPVPDSLPQVIGPYGDPLLNVLCPRDGWQVSPVCSSGNPIESDICKHQELSTSQTCDGALHADLLGRFLPGIMPLRPVDSERLVAEFVLAKLNNQLSAYRFAVPISELFPDTYVDCSFGACTLVLKPARELGPKSPIGILRDRLNTNAGAFSYAVMPTEWSQALATEDLTRTSLLAALRTAAASGGENLEAALEGLNEFEERVETRYRNPIVFGFGTEPAVERRNQPSSWLDSLFNIAAQVSASAAQENRAAAQDSDNQEGQKARDGGSDIRTHFGWIIRPRLAPLLDGGGRSFRQMPGFYPLSAVVSVPSWWRRLKIEVHTEWVDPNGWWGAPQSIAADLLAARGEDCTKPKCDIHFLRVPGSVNEIKQKLNYEVRRDPYIDFKTTARDQFLEIGRSGQLVLEGGRLWRSTVVRMGHQEADKIFVLPDMKGIIAEFSCVQPVPGDKGMFDEATHGQAPPEGPDLDTDHRLTALVHVWTSEGRTADPLLVFLRPFVTRKIGEGDNAEYLKPCFLDDENQAARGAANDGDESSALHGRS